MRNILILTVILLSASVFVGCSKRRVEITESVTTETTVQKGHRVRTIRRIPSGQMIRITDVEKVEIEGDRPILGAMISPLPAVGRRASHNIGMGKILTTSDIWWEPRSAYAQSDIVLDDLKLARARWHEKEDLSAEEEFKNSSLQGVASAPAPAAGAEPAKEAGDTKPVSE